MFVPAEPRFVICLCVLVSTMIRALEKTRNVPVVFFFFPLGQAVKARGRKALGCKKKKVWSEVTAASHQLQTLYFGPR